METTESIQIEAISEGLLDQGHQAKRHKVLIHDIQQESLKETPQNLPHEALRVASTQALRSQRLSSASKLPTPCDPRPVRHVLQTGQAGFGLTATLGLRPRLCGSAE
jgi:hypothetical protein